jgi:UDP-N-acetylglucosamine--N-acetylmuramyl-(pentapeptide) pyrophosphoryl-undecaprenol N-acetylglucosamine transferase
MSGPILIMAGGTGGHVFPALAVALALRARSREVVWLGTRRGLEARVVPAAGFPIEWVTVSGLRGKGLVSWLTAPLRLLVALAQSLSIIRRRRPAAVLGMGGFVTGPGGVAAWLTRRPLVIHEQNAIAGMSNRLLARFAGEVLEGFPESFPAGLRARCIGNPVRPDMFAQPPPEVRFASRSGRARLLVLGGSLGAQALNEIVPAALARIPESMRPDVRHQTGERTLATAQEAYARAGVEATIAPFIEDMAGAYAWADLVLCRAGAITIAELAAVGVGAILVPFPHAVDDHQTHNAAWLVRAGAAELMQQQAIDAPTLAERLQALLPDRAALLAMAERARGVAKPEATVALEQACLAAAGAAS